MTASLLTLTAFAIVWLVGLATLTAMGACTTQLRVTLTAPAVGTCVVLLPEFMLSHAGMAIEHVALPLVAVLSVAGAITLAIRRPAMPLTVVPVLVICGIGFVLAAGPMRPRLTRNLAPASQGCG